MDPETRHHLTRLDEALAALAVGLARLLINSNPPREAPPTPPTSLDSPADAGLSVPAGERRLSASADAAGTYGRSA
ncbi:MAG: hypothetical protein LAT64_02610 [Phycisphaerales bacterium]|nr:hypothetical protein [Planctomycetota bacterium]MCH8507650.1 hypothetical protein [Phycisphaerales bacterium]